MPERVVITGIGIVSALGMGSDAHILALRNGESGVGKVAHLQSVHAADFVLGEVKMSNDELAILLGLPTGDNGHTRTTLLCLAAMKDLLGHAPISLLQNEPFAFINANTSGGMSKFEEIYMDVLGDRAQPDNVQYIATLDCGESTENVALHFGLKPFMATISTACSSSANALMLGARMIKQGMVKRAVCGGGDALSRFTLNGFHSLKNVDKNACRPFDQNRGGLNLGEAAAYCLLEAESVARARGADIIAVLSGYANTNDAYHVTSPSPDGAGACQTMAQALQMAGLQHADVGYINTHGTATQNNDLSEGLAIQQLFGAPAPAFSSTKPYTGHTLAAAGVVEAIFSMWAMQEGTAWPNLHFEQRMDELAISPLTQTKSDITINHVLSNSFGFGGSNVSLVFSKP